MHRQAHTDRLRSLDIFRGIAVLLVVLFHFTARIPPEHLNSADTPLLVLGWGGIGVFIFFVISGYCISQTLERGEGAAMFLLRRVSRIYLPFFVAVILAFVFALIFNVPEFDLTSAQLRFVEPGWADLLANIFMLRELGFDWIDGVYWSLLVELKFYLFVAIVFLFVPRAQKLRGVFIGMSLIATSVWIAAFSQHMDLVAKLMRHGFIAPYLPFFALGMLLNMMRGHMRDNMDLRAGLIFVVLLLQCNVALLIELTDFTYLIAFNLLLLAMSLTILNQAAARLCNVGLGWLAPIGLISYSLYLFHNNIGLTIIRELNPYVAMNVSIMIAIGASILISVASYKLVEQILARKFLARGTQFLKRHQLAAT